MEAEKIISIVEFDESEAGYLVTTNKQTVKLAIDNYQDCCESWGYFWSNDNPQDFIGAELLGITVTDTLLNTEKLDRIEYLENGGVMFVTLDTTQGQLQFVAYNSHNGYYGHEAKIVSTQLTHSEVL